MLFKNNVFFIIIATVACTPIIPWLSKICTKNKVVSKVWSILGMIVPTALIVISALALAGDSYNPFLYFQF
jgi:alginate O-acetyltransferase complex protein AlgI